MSAIIGAGIIPGGMEMMDRPAIHAVEEFVHAGYPLDVEALLIVELDGPSAEEMCIRDSSYIVKPVDFVQFTESVRDIGKYWLVINHAESV